MYLYFEEDGAFKAGTVVSETGNAYQVTVTTGRRTKIKAAKVFFTFESPAPAELLEAAETTSAELAPGFLWEVAPAISRPISDVEMVFGSTSPMIFPLYITATRSDRLMISLSSLEISSTE